MSPLLAARLPGQRKNPPKECVYGDTTNPKLTVALVGDSIAGNWFPALEKIALQQHWELVTEMRATVPDCVAKYGASSKCDVQVAKAIVPDPPTVYATRDMAGKVKEIDMNDLICARARCRAVVGNVLVYFDSHHLTASYSKTMAAYLKPRLLASSPAFGITHRGGNRAAAPPKKKLDKYQTGLRTG